MLELHLNSAADPDLDHAFFLENLNPVQNAAIYSLKDVKSYLIFISFVRK
jgi:hypothetical protein